MRSLTVPEMCHGDGQGLLLPHPSGVTPLPAVSPGVLEVLNSKGGSHSADSPHFFPAFSRRMAEQAVLGLPLEDVTL